MKMSLIGKICFYLLLFVSGVAVGLYFSPNSEFTEKNELNVVMEGKVKKGSDVVINVEDINQEFEKEEKQTKKDKRRLKRKGQ